MSGTVGSKKEDSSLYRFITTERSEVRFSSTELAELQTIALPIVDGLLNAGLLDKDSALRLTVAVQEALVNGLEHGNLELDSRWKEEYQEDGRDRFSVLRQTRLADKEFGDRQILLRTLFTGDALHIVVRDSGRGFLPETEGALVIEQPEDWNAVSCSGRGLAIMANAVDKVEFSHNGSEVTLVKILQNRGGSAHGT